MSLDSPWKILKSNQIYDNAWIKLTEHQVINPAGGQGIYGEVHFKNLAIGVVVLDEDYNTWLVGQYRFPLKAYSWEIPEGGGLHTVDPMLSAKRELQEETGIIATKFTEIQKMHLSNSVTDEMAIIYIAQDLQIGDSSPEETEELVVRKLAFDEAYQMVMTGEITDSMSVAGILKTKILIEQGKI
ncbi:NUDIX domain-containing protein [Pedobacter insulae]|uniref:NUDIX domain-containing protein n=1 Tax=Pedobacter insulae TaxID=414048 RepID=A0A1I2YWT1_9SPHI|nr:NUDIX hydrolase [Pedobacter insulae]SFH29885.1 NUDIX domain-containing protein [Pedobacter insulae]